MHSKEGHGQVSNDTKVTVRGDNQNVTRIEPTMDEEPKVMTKAPIVDQVS